ncbi:MAG: acyl-CoA dehydrogenase family protein [bacterium]|nr:acyl-CoA dehydrogenase family protein [Acidimicrobiia bacterium]MCY4649793.1 acyl-CoA dehydrogenase family protein [bacterium]
MDFQLSPEHQLFRQTLRRFVDDEIRPVANEWEHSGRYPTEIVESMKQMGLFGITVPEEYGGLGADFVSLALVFEEISRGWMGIAGILGTHSLACFIIARHGTEEQKDRFLADLASGERRTGIALTEPDAGTDLQGIKTRAIRDGDHYVISGSKLWITNARYADPLPVLVKTDPDTTPAHRGMSLILVEKGTEGFEVSRDLPKLGYKGTESCEVQLDNVRVPVENLVGGVEGRGFQQVMSGLEIGRINIAARAVGIAQEAYNQALAYANDREAFGRKISGFQAIQLKLAEMATNTQAARLLVWWAASQADQGKRVDMEAGMAKYFASEVACTNALDSMRIHGGMGYSQELDIERLYRDAPLMVIGEGTNEIMRMVIARGLISGRVVVD